MPGVNKLCQVLTSAVLYQAGEQTFWNVFSPAAGLRVGNAVSFTQLLLFFCWKNMYLWNSSVSFEGPNIWLLEYSVRLTFQFVKFQWLYLKTLCTFYLKLIIENCIACLHYFKVSFKTLKPRVTQYDYISQEIIRMKCLSNSKLFSLYSFFTT